MKKKLKSAKKIVQSPFKNYWSKDNYIILILGLVILIIGYFLLSQPPWDNPLSLTLAPIVLLIAYLAIIPFSIIYRKKTNNNNDNK